MSAIKYFILAVVVVLATAEEPKQEDRVKKDVLLGTLPYAYAAYPHVYDYPKYVAHVPAVPYVHHVSPYSAAVPAYVQSPGYIGAYGAYVKPAVVY